jgi:hypothetical protein
MWGWWSDLWPHFCLLSPQLCVIVQTSLLPCFCNSSITRFLLFKSTYLLTYLPSIMYYLITIATLILFGSYLRTFEPSPFGQFKSTLQYKHVHTSVVKVSGLKGKKFSCSTQELNHEKNVFC